jgi:CDP-diacylglycerol--serine O-phosphatidyltransferase
VAVDHGIAGSDVSYLILVVTGVTGLLMVSNFRYNSFKEVDIRGKVPFFSIVVIMLVFAVVIVQPPLVLFLIFLLYAVSGPVLTLFHLRRRRTKRKSAVSGGDEKPAGDPDA